MLGAVIGGAAAIGGQFLCKTEACKIFAGLGGAAAGFAVTFFDMKFSRSNETEADDFGQQYMARAGYEPSEAISLWERMEKASGGKSPPEFMSTHPSSVNRRIKLREWLPEAQSIYARAPQKFGLGAEIK